MRHHTSRSDTQTLVDGGSVAGDDALAGVEDFFDAMRREAGSLPAPEPRPTLASILDGRRPLRPASEPVPSPPLRPRFGPRAHRLRPLVVTFATGAILFSGLASAGALPGPIQRVSAEIGSHVGLHLPGYHGPSATPAPATGHSDPAHPTRGRPRPGNGPHVSTPSTTVTVPAGGTTPSTLPVPNPATLPVPDPGTLPQPGALPKPGELGLPLPPLPPLPPVSDGKSLGNLAG